MKSSQLFVVSSMLLMHNWLFSYHREILSRASRAEALFLETRGSQGEVTRVTSNQDLQDTVNIGQGGQMLH